MLGQRVLDGTRASKDQQQLIPHLRQALGLGVGLSLLPRGYLLRQDLADMPACLTQLVGHQPGRRVVAGDKAPKYPVAYDGD